MRTHTWIRLAAFAALLFLLAPFAQAQNRITCASEQNRRQFCPADTRGGVRLVRQLSDAACREGVSWGYDRRGIWVDRGCRAEFEIRTAPSGSRGPVWRGESTVVVCASERNQPNYCPADTRGGVWLRRQISDAPCREGDTWGYDRRGIWVNRGCRAEFDVATGFGNDEPEIITCSSEERRRQFCPADTRGGVRLVRQISDTQCRERDTWGYDRNGIWVDRGCRGEFEVGSRFGRRRRSAEPVIVKCESRNRRRQVCAVETRGTVRLARQLSDTPCTEGRTWGYDARGIWVDRGCRGEFEIREEWGRFGSGVSEPMRRVFRACQDEVERRVPGTQRGEVAVDDVTQGGPGAFLVEWQTRGGASGYCRLHANGRLLQFQVD